MIRNRRLSLAMSAMALSALGMASFTVPAVADDATSQDSTTVEQVSALVSDAATSAGCLRPTSLRTLRSASRSRRMLPTVLVFMGPMVLDSLFLLLSGSLLMVVWWLGTAPLSMPAQKGTRM